MWNGVEMCDLAEIGPMGNVPATLTQHCVELRLMTLHRECSSNATNIYQARTQSVFDYC